jgi:hypothetical protein
MSFFILFSGLLSFTGRGELFTFRYLLKKKYSISAFWYGLVVHFKIYPILYALPIYFFIENEKLLLNILPPQIATRLRSGEQTIADSFPNVAVLFADLVGFTRLSQENGAEKIVELLNQLFSNSVRPMFA